MLADYYSDKKLGLCGVITLLKNPSGNAADLNDFTDFEDFVPLVLKDKGANQ